MKLSEQGHSASIDQSSQLTRNGHGEWVKIKIVLLSHLELRLAYYHGMTWPILTYT